MDLLVIGDSAIDLYMKLEGMGVKEMHSKICFFHGSKVIVEQMEERVAGNAVNVAIGCKRLGVITGIYTEVGEDQNGNKIISELQAHGIDTSTCDINKDKPTNVHAVIVHGGDRTIFSYHENYEYKIENWPKAKWVYYTSMGRTFEVFQSELIDWVESNKVGVAFNPGTIQMEMGVESFKPILPHTHVLFLNKEESIKLVGNGSIEKLHKKLQVLGPKLTVITDGKRGASAHDGKDFIESEIYSDERPVLDKTGAGDAFASGFLSAIIAKKPMDEALLWGVINSGSVVKEIGASRGLLDRDTMETTVRNLRAERQK